MVSSEATGSDETAVWTFSSYRRPAAKRRSRADAGAKMLKIKADREARPAASDPGRFYPEI